MDLRDIFKSFFGLSDRGQRNRNDDDPCSCIPDDGFDYEEHHGDTGLWRFGFGNIDDIFRHFHGDMRQQMDEMHRAMDDMFQNFGQTEFPAIDDERQSPRDEMLKQPDTPRKDNWSNDGNDDWFNFTPRNRKYGHFSPRTVPKIDEDVSDVNTDDIIRLYDKTHMDREEPTQTKSHYSRVTVRINNKDGVIHEKRTVCDSEGKCETTTTTRSADGSHNTPRDQMIREDPKTKNVFNTNKPKVGIWNKLGRLWTFGNKAEPDRNIASLPSDESLSERLFGPTKR